ncbi:MAG TPA: ATP-binding protein, partial [Gammaproteobacteria bacterium]|nr:ATP-binding protein [Gammaproteobacteria bacterium]
EASIKPDLERMIGFAHPDDRLLIRQAIAATLSQRNDINQEIRITRADGQERVVYFQTHCLASKHGDISRIIGNVTDITDRKREDTERLQAMKLHALGSLSSGMAHSLNNLILPILISSRMVLKNLPKTGSQDDRERLNRVVMAAERASELIAKVLAFSHREVPSFTRINFSDVVRNALRLIQVTSPAAVKIESSIFNEAVMIMGDAAKLETIILDLASNAFASMEGMNGRLSLATRLQDVEQDMPGFPVNVLPGHYVVLEVEDTGVGMDANVMNKIFEPFFTTKSNGMGTGLGLANVEGTVSMHNGYMQVRSTPGAGSSFTLYFPID